MSSAVGLFRLGGFSRDSRLETKSVQVFSSLYKIPAHSWIRCRPPCVLISTVMQLGILGPEKNRVFDYALPLKAQLFEVPY